MTTSPTRIRQRICRDCMGGEICNTIGRMSDYMYEYYAYEEFTQNRIAQLRLQKEVSARDMSLSLGQNDSYINRIENKKAVPSLQGLFYICEYFGITPQEFFDEGNAYPDRLAELVEDMKQLDEKALSLLAELAKQLIRKK